MPIVFENPNRDEAIARIVFDKDLFTVFYRSMTCGAGAVEGKEFLSIIKTEVPQLINYNPVIIEMHSEPRHKHFKARDTTLSHVHLGFDKSIEQVKSIKLLIRVINKLQSTFNDSWVKWKKVADANLGESSCGLNLFSDTSGLISSTHDFLKNNLSYTRNPSICLWAKPNLPMQVVECALLPDEIPTSDEIHASIQTMMDLFKQQQLNKPRNKINNLNSLTISETQPGAISESTSLAISEADSDANEEASLQTVIMTSMVGLLIILMCATPLVRRVRRMF
jgi:hypothetical protein